MDDLLKALIGLGPPGIIGGLMFWMWWQERLERRDLMTKVIGLVTEAVSAEKDMTAALQVLASKVKV